ncbi:hypothetical protein LSTR_LSTR012950 [Laodelphax striatellus]|uniref:Uncharacterized protein n=1 Tax=Laodelphax striatellus TaxID=195883 RepID=A0A482X0C3_LAOST|nr:hypothetical protein LSTR_LSTR012950 [Laodelphax striatellus]
MENPKQSLNHLKAIEKQAEDILRDKSEIVALDRRRNGNREGLRALKKQTNTDKTWFAIGPILVKVPVQTANKWLDKDQVTVSAEINKIRSDMKVKVNNLRDLEFQDPVPGLNLKPLDRDEMNAINQVMGGHV